MTKNDSICRKNDYPELLEISETVQEAKNLKSYFFKHSLNCKPGQFIMVWVPGVDEKPMAVSYFKANEFAFTSQKIGIFTKSLDKLRKGDKVGVRGPYGNSYSLNGNSCVVGGGVGMASVSTLIEKLKNPTIINGGRSKNYLLYLKRFKNKKMIVTTDDGSYGKKGFVTEVLKDEIIKNKIKVVYTCGPEIMMRKVFEICKRYKVECEVSLERYMGCGFGICGKCMADDKIVCVDGPIFNSKELRQINEFGRFARLKSGRRVSLKEYNS